MSGRRDFYERNSSNQILLQRFEKTLDDVKAGRTDIAIAAKEFEMSERSIRNYIESREQRSRAAATHAEVEKWSQLPGIERYENWLKLRQNDSQRPKTLAYVQELWEKVWQKKSLTLLTEEDIVQAALYIPKRWNRAFNAMVALRSLIRGGGYGRHEWLSIYLDTKNLKGPVRIPPEFYTKEQLLNVIPRLEAALAKMLADGEINPEEWRLELLVMYLKSTIGIRTGKRKADKRGPGERELWGMRINAGRTNLMLDGEGKVLSMEVFAKKKEIWRIPARFLLPEVKAELEKYIADMKLKTGDYLLPEWFDIQYKAQRILHRATDIAGMSRLILHDFRKLYATSLVLSGIPMEIAMDFGVGWKNADTMKKFYVMIKALNAEAEFDKLAVFQKQMLHPVPAQ